MEPVRITKDSRGVSLTDTVLLDGSIYDLTGATVTLSMRDQTGALKINATAANVVSPATAGKLRYDWSALNVDTAGEYWAWWRITPAVGTAFDLPEFLVYIEGHVDGGIAQLGKVADLARQHMPVTWDRLAQDVRYGNRMLKDRVDVTKYRLFGTVVAASAESTTYDLFVLDYLGKVVAYSLIPAAIEYWTDSHQSLSATGTAETVSYPDRLRALENLGKRLAAEITDMQPDVDAIVPHTRRRTGGYAAVDTTGPLVTSDPGAFPRLYATTHSWGTNFPVWSDV